MSAAPNSSSAASAAQAPEEDVEFPILCETCLGPNPYVRMTKTANGKACKICDIPFTVFRWLPGPNARYKKTEICRSCAKAKNVCQTCIFDLQYGLPVQVRDALLKAGERVSLPDSDINRAYALRQLDAKMEANGGTLPQYTTSNPLLEQLARRGPPDYSRNRAHLCSFFARGACTRGDLCPYRHEMPQEGQSTSRQNNIKDRFHGTNDALAGKYLSRAATASKLTPPDDATITTLFVGGLPEQASEADVRDAFTPYGDLSSVRVLPAKNCAFVTYFRRAAAEEAAVRLHNTLYIAGKAVKLSWGKRQSTAHAPGAPGAAAAAAGGAGAAGAGLGGAAVPAPPRAGSSAAAAGGAAGGAVGGTGKGGLVGNYPSMQSGYLPSADALARPPGL